MNMPSKATKQRTAIQFMARVAPFKLKTWSAAACLMALSGTAPAALVSQGNGTVLDTTTNLIWLQDWNVNGRIDWVTQKAWAEGLSFAGSSEWVLPSVSDFHTLYREVGNLGEVNVFINVKFDYYWTSWSQIIYRPVDNQEDNQYAPGRTYGVAVRPGDVVAVPEPETYALVLAGLGALGLIRRRRGTAL